MSWKEIGRESLLRGHLCAPVGVCTVELQAFEHCWAAARGEARGMRGREPPLRHWALVSGALGAHAGSTALWLRCGASRTQGPPPSLVAGCDAGFSLPLRWARAQVWASTSTWLSLAALTPPWEMQSTWRPSGKCPGFLSRGALQTLGDSPPVSPALARFYQCSLTFLSLTPHPGRALAGPSPSTPSGPCTASVSVAAISLSWFLEP